MTSFLFGLASPVAYFFVFIFLILCGVGNPIPEDTVLIAGGYLAYADVVNIYWILVLCYVGVICGDLILYGFGRKYGQKIITHPKFLRMIPLKRVDKIRKGFHRHGNWMIFFARFLVGFRSPTFLLSGVMHIPFKRFLIIDCLGGLVSVPFFVGLGYLFGTHVDAIREDVTRYKHWAFIVVILAIVAFVVWRWFRGKKEEHPPEHVLRWEHHEAEKKVVENEAK